MIIDSRSLPAEERIDTDVCIVGGGAAGITLAHELIGSPFQVTILESGDVEIDAATQELYAGEIVGHAYHALDVSRLRFFGGTTNHWAGYCRPLEPLDFEARSYVPNSGWPFGLEELEGYYQRAQPLCQVGKFAYDAQSWSVGTHRPYALDPRRIVSGVFQIGPPPRFGAAYRDALHDAGNVRVLLNANAVDIEMDDGRVRALRVACLDAKTFRVNAKIFVLAAGAIENARLLLCSNGAHPAGVGNAYGNVGRYFMDHPIIWQSGQIVTNERWPQSQFYSVEAPIHGVKIIGILNVAPEVQRREQLFNSGILLDPVNLSARSDAVTSAKQILQAVRNGRLPDQFATHVGRMFDELEDFRELAEAAHRRLFRPTPRHFTTRCWTECPPDPESRVLLGDDVDRLGLRRVRLDWRLPSDLARSFQRTHELLALELGRQGIGRLQIGLDGSVDEAIASAEGSFHQMGTTRMHASPRRGVVDPQCRVHDIANLFIAGSSVFPTYGHTNPTLTIVALAIRLADHIKAQLGQGIGLDPSEQLSAAPDTSPQ